MLSTFLLICANQNEGIEYNNDFVSFKLLFIDVPQVKTSVVQSGKHMYFLARTLMSYHGLHKLL